MSAYAWRSTCVTLGRLAASERKSWVPAESRDKRASLLRSLIRSAISSIAGQPRMHMSQSLPSCIRAPGRQPFDDRPSPVGRAVHLEPASELFGYRVSNASIGDKQPDHLVELIRYLFLSQAS